MPEKRRAQRAATGSSTAAPTAVDLFAGAGGASQGLRDAGFDILAAVENDAAAADSYNANHKTTTLFRQDIRDVKIPQLAKDIESAAVELTLINACPPCQGFSTLGSAAQGDPRNDLIATVWPFVTAMRPRAVVVENVPGIRTDARLRLLLRQARAVGYSARSYTIEAADLGVPQRRRRHLVVAMRDAARPLPAQPRELLTPLPGRPVAVGTVFEQSARIDPGTDPQHVARTLRVSTRDRVRVIPVGGSRFDLPDDKQLACHRRLQGRHATGPYGRMRADEPAPTLTTRCTTVSCGSFIHPTEDRGITLREAAMIQTFPHDYAFYGGYDSVERQIGNALPPMVAEAVGRAILALL